MLCAVGQEVGLFHTDKQGGGSNLGPVVPVGSPREHVGEEAVADIFCPHSTFTLPGLLRKALPNPRGQGTGVLNLAVAMCNTYPLWPSPSP